MNKTGLKRLKRRRKIYNRSRCHGNSLSCERMHIRRFKPIKKVEPIIKPKEVKLKWDYRILKSLSSIIQRLIRLLRRK